MSRYFFEIRSKLGSGKESLCWEEYCVTTSLSARDFWLTARQPQPTEKRSHPLEVESACANACSLPAWPRQGLQWVSPRTQMTGRIMRCHWCLALFWVPADSGSADQIRWPVTSSRIARSTLTVFSKCKQMQKPLGSGSDLSQPEWLHAQGITSHHNTL